MRDRKVTSGSSQGWFVRRISEFRQREFAQHACSLQRIRSATTRCLRLIYGCHHRVTEDQTRPGPPGARSRTTENPNQVLLDVGGTVDVAKLHADCEVLYQGLHQCAEAPLVD